MSNLLIAVVTCHKYRARADVIRETWAQGSSIPVRFFIGGGQAERDDEIVLDCDDGYNGLPRKVQLAFAWAVAQGFDYTFKTDDDVYVIPDRLVTNFIVHDYVGRMRPASQENDAPRIYGPSERAFCSGFGYWLSRRAAQIIASTPLNGDWAEDRFVGNVLVRHNILPCHDHHILLWPPIAGHMCTAPNPGCQRCVWEYDHASVVCPYARPEVIPTLHQWWQERRFIPTNLP